YAIFRGLYPEMFHAAHQTLNVKLGAINTLVLITSSFSMAWGVGATQRGRRDQAILALALTILFAGMFLVIKYFEYTHKVHDGLLPAGMFHNEHLKDPKAPLFFSLYFMMTGLHGVHVVIGIGLITWLIARTLRKDFSPHFYTPVELVGFYWHFVDLVW